LPSPASSDPLFEVGHPRESNLSREQRAELESRNSIELTGVTFLLASQWSEHAAQRINRKLILRLNRLAVRDLEPDAGMFRTKPRLVADHVPPKSQDVERFIDEMCDHAKRQVDMFYCAAFLLWRLNWIHPFSDGNGRVSRALCAICLSVEIGVSTAHRVIPGLLDRKNDYFAALESADKKWAKSDQDYSDSEVVSEMQMLLHDIYCDILLAEPQT
jgi:Fic family protein